MALVTTGNPFVGYAQLKSGVLGPVVFTLYTELAGASAYTLAAAAAKNTGPGPDGVPPMADKGFAGTPTAERIYITNCSIVTNDTGPDLVTIDSGAGNAVLISTYVSAAVPYLMHFPPGVMRLHPSVPPRATASAIAPGSTIEISIHGYIGRT